MKFYPLLGTPLKGRDLKTEYAGARAFGHVRTGETALFFRSGLKTYYVPYQDMKQCFRRIFAVPMKMCCGKGDLEIEHLIIGDGEKEIADIQLPGKRAAQEIMKILREKAPDTDFRSPAERSKAAAQGEAPADCGPVQTEDADSACSCEEATGKRGA